MQNALHNFITKHTGENRFPDLRVGWTVRVYQKIKEGEKAKSQMFEGVIIARQHGDEPGATITVRKMTGGTGVEKILPLRLPSIEKIEVVKRPRVRRAKLYYLRDKSAKEIRRKTKHEIRVPADSASVATPAKETVPTKALAEVTS